MEHLVYLVDDDRNLLNAIAEELKAEGLAVRGFSDGFEALEAVRQEPPDLAILDIKMPSIDGFELLSRMRKEGDASLPVIFLTSKDDELDELLGLRMGADDYVTKPVTARLLVERIRALLRRRELSFGRGETEPAVERGDLYLDPSRHECLWKKQKIRLTVTEFLLLKTLAVRPGHIKSRKQLMEAAYGDSIHVDDRTIDSHVKRLRAKFRQVDPDFALIETLYGIGYRYREAALASS
jgi:two-component system response regulator ChvI